MLVTEGALKATIAHTLSKRSFLAVAGASQVEALRPAFTKLRMLGCKNIYEAYDMDKLQNEHVRAGADKMLELAQSYGFHVERLRWDSRFKGVDDYYLARMRQRKD